MSTRALELMGFIAFTTPLLLMAVLFLLYWRERRAEDNRSLEEARSRWSSAISGGSSVHEPEQFIRLLPPGPYDVVQRGEL
jgi:hypothetical protein